MYSISTRIFYFLCILHTPSAQTCAPCLCTPYLNPTVLICESTRIYNFPDFIPMDLEINFLNITIINTAIRFLPPITISTYPSLQFFNDLINPYLECEAVVGWAGNLPSNTIINSDSCDLNKPGVTTIYTHSSDLMINITPPLSYNATTTTSGLVGSSTTAKTTSSPIHEGNVQYGIIIGVAVSGLVLGIIVGVGACWWCRRMSASRDLEEPIICQMSVESIELDNISTCTDNPIYNPTCTE